MRAIFMGAPAFAVPALCTLANQGAKIAAVYTKAPRPAGRRGLEPTKTQVHVEAERLGLEVRTPATLRDPETLDALRALEADFAIVAAYGLLLPPAALAAPRLGCFNLHASLLPRWRGAAPIQRAIMAGDAETGVSIMRMEAGLDTGPVAGELRTGIGPSETAEELTHRLADLAARTLSENLGALAEGRLTFTPQSETGVTYARKIDKSEAPIDWRRSAVEINNHIRALSPFPGAVTELRAGGGSERLKILRAEVVEGSGAPGEVLDKLMSIACWKGAVRCVTVQRAGRKATSGVEFMRSGALRIGDILQSAATTA